MIVGLYFPFGKLIFEIVNTEVMKKSGPGSCLGIPSELSGNEPGDIRNVQTVHEAGCLKMLLIPLKLFEFGIVQNALHQTAVLGADIIRNCNLHRLSHPFRRERVRIFRGLNGAGKTVTAEIFFYMESEPSDKQILYLSKGSEEILIFHRNILADEPVPHHAAGRKRCGNVDQALIFGAAECKADVFLSLDKFPINEDIEQGKHLIRAFAPSTAFGQKI